MHLPTDTAVVLHGAPHNEHRRRATRPVLAHKGRAGALHLPSSNRNLQVALSFTIEGEAPPSKINVKLKRPTRLDVLLGFNLRV